MTASLDASLQNLSVFACARAHVHDFFIWCERGAGTWPPYISDQLSTVCRAALFVFIVFVSRVHQAVCRASPGHVPTPGPLCQCGRRQRTCVPAASRTDTDTWEVVCSTDQAPESLNLCCHSLPSAGPDPPFPGRVPRALVNPICPAGSRSGRAGRAGMCAGFGSDAWHNLCCVRTCLLCAHSVTLAGSDGGRIGTPPMPIPP